MKAARCPHCSGLLAAIPEPGTGIQPTRALRVALAASLEDFRAGLLATSNPKDFDPKGIDRIAARIDAKLRLLRARGPLDVEAFSALADVRVYPDEFTRALLPLLCVCSDDRKAARLAWSVGSSLRALSGELDSAVVVLEGMKESWAGGVAAKLKPRVGKLAAGATWESLAEAGDKTAATVERWQREQGRRRLPSA